MTPLERVQVVVAGQTPDRVPVHHVAISSWVASKVLGGEAYGRDWYRSKADRCDTATLIEAD